MVAPIFIRVFQKKKVEDTEENLSNGSSSQNHGQCLRNRRETKLRTHLSWNIHPSYSIHRFCDFAFSTLRTPVG